MDTNKFPVERATWFDAIEFCNQLGKLDGFEPYYKIEDIKREADNIKNAKVTVVGGNGYRLPTEAEWEFACRSGTNRQFFFGNTNTGKEANLKPGPAIGYGSDPHWPTADRTEKVGSYKPNYWGLYAMHGNAAEWCWDFYGRDYYVTSPEKDPPGPDAGPHRVLRGGSWLVNEHSCRAASRFFYLPEEVNYTAGFRIARSP